MLLSPLAWMLLSQLSIKTRTDTKTTSTIRYGNLRPDSPSLSLSEKPSVERYQPQENLKVVTISTYTVTKKKQKKKKKTTNP